MEGQGFRARTPDFQALGAVVVGASFNTVEANREFATEQGFDFDLLSDVDRVAGSAYDVLREPGQDFQHKPRRVTYLVAPDGRIAHSYAVRDDLFAHAGQVLEDLTALVGGPTNGD